MQIQLPFLDLSAAIKVHRVALERICHASGYHGFSSDAIVLPPIWLVIRKKGEAWRP